jgi:hypothetical protein
MPRDGDAGRASADQDDVLEDKGSISCRESTTTAHGEATASVAQQQPGAKTVGVR